MRRNIKQCYKKVDPEPNETSGKNKFKEKDEKPLFGTRPDTKSPAFNFKKELERLPFELNIGDAPLTQEQQAHLRSYRGLFLIRRRLRIL